MIEEEGLIQRMVRAFVTGPLSPLLLVLQPYFVEGIFHRCY